METIGRCLPPESGKFCTLFDTIAAIGDGTADAVLPDLPALRNHIASQHAGALFTVAEAAYGAVMMGSFGDLMGATTAAVRDASIRYLKVARGPITAQARLEGDATELRGALAQTGRVNFDVAVALQDQAGLTVATETMAWSLRGRA